MILQPFAEPCTDLPPEELLDAIEHKRILDALDAQIADTEARYDRGQRTARGLSSRPFVPPSDREVRLGILLALKKCPRPLAASEVTCQLSLCSHGGPGVSKRVYETLRVLFLEGTIRARTVESVDHRGRRVRYPVFALPESRDEGGTP